MVRALPVFLLLSEVVTPKRRRILKFVLLGIIVYLLCAGVLLWSARSDVLAGRDALTTLADTDPLAVEFDVLEEELAEAAEPVGRGSSKLNSPFLWPLRPLPIVGRQLASARSLANVADVVVGDTRDVVARADQLQTVDEGDRVEALAELEEALIVLSDNLAGADLGPENNLFGVLADARLDAEQRLVDLRLEADDARVVVSGLRSFLDSSDYLVMAANINEMQVGAGTPLSLGAVSVDNSDFTVTSFETIEDIEIPAGLQAVDEDVDELWGFLSPTNDFKKLMLSARFDEFGGPQSLVLYESVTGETPGGTLVLDPVALQALLTVVGPIQVGDDEFSAENVLRYIFVDQYEEFLTGDEVSLDNLSTLGPGQDARRDQLAGIAVATVDALANEPWEPLDLINAFRPVAAGRHIMAYSTIPEEQAMWEALGIAGQVDGNEVGVALLNIGANKLDPFVQVDAVVTEGPADPAQPDGDRALEIEVTVANNSPITLPQGATGYYWETLGLPTPASYLGRMMFLLPEGTTELTVSDPSLKVEVFGRDGPLVVMVVRLEALPEGTSTTVVANATVAADTTGGYRIMPSARYLPIGYSWNGLEFNDSVFTEVPLG